LAKPTVGVLVAWMKEQGKEGSKILFPSARGGPLSSDSVQYLARIMHEGQPGSGDSAESG
jgi:hypothetical protein